MRIVGYEDLSFGEKSRKERLMIKIRSLTVLGSLLAMAALLAVACGDDVTPTPVTVIVTATPGPSPTPVIIAGTPVVVTATPGPSPTPVMVVVTATPAPVPTAAPITARAGGTVRQYGRRDPRSFDTHNSGSSHEVRVNAKLYNGLMWNPEGDTFECDLCTSFALEDGGKTLVFNLIQGVKFQDGSELKAADVRYSLRKLMGLEDGIASSRAGFIKEYIDTIDVRDDYTVAINMFRPAPVVPKILAMHVAGIYKEGTTADEAKAEPKGTGPFLIKEAVPGVHLTLGRNPEYFKEGRPLLDELQFVYVRDVTAGAAAFITGRIDLYLEFELMPKAFDDSLEELVNEGKIVRQLPWGGAAPIGLMFNLTRSPFDDIRVRKAIHLGIDRQAFCEVVYSNRCVLHGLYPADSEFRRSADELSQLPGYRQPKDQDIAEALSLLAAAGFSQGLEVDFLMWSFHEKMAEFLAEDLRNIGVTANLQLTDVSSFNQGMAEKNYDIAYFMNGLATLDPDEVTGSPLLTGAPRNYSGFGLERMDQLFVQQSSELDLQRRKVLTREIEDLYLEELPIIGTGEPQREQAWWTYVHFNPGFSSHLQERLETVWTER